jgi:hypothetical protein
MPAEITKKKLRGRASNPPIPLEVTKNQFFPYYNERRWHQGLGNRTPHELLYGTSKKRAGGAGAGRRPAPPFGSK